MIKIGDKVAPISRMSMTGVVVDLVPYKVKAWMVGGAIGQTFKARVKLDKDQEIREWMVQELMRIE